MKNLLSSALYVAILALVQVNAEANKGDAVLQDLAGRDTGDVRRLKESLTSNPNCPPAKYPACIHGKVHEDSCTCKCAWNFQGPACNKCNNKVCLNGGKMNGDCKCVCSPGFTGPQCGAGSRCLHGGTDKSGTCQCAGSWSGPVCAACGLTCSHGGTLNKKTCSCKCKVPYQPPQCKVCADPGCEHGGKWDFDTCSCKCLDFLAWTGPKCSTCKNPGCINGGKFDPAQCQCKCPNQGNQNPDNQDWGGTKCQLCKRVCTNGKTLNAKTCTCAEEGQPSFNPCVTGCRHGTLDKEACTCACEEGWKGPLCDTCERDKCFNGAVHNPKTCECSCVPPWAGDECKTCTLKCAHGELKDHCGGCACHAVQAGSWSGTTCNICQHKPCVNGGTLDHSSCTCKCRKGYAGSVCEKCIVTQGDCIHGSSFVPAKCGCDCSHVQGDWSGRFCDMCKHKGCENSGELDRKTCMCECVPKWKGRYCNTCDEEWCGPQETPSGQGREGFTSKLIKSKECTWLRELGCPSN